MRAVWECRSVNPALIGSCLGRISSFAERRTTSAKLPGVFEQPAIRRRIASRDATSCNPGEQKMLQVFTRAELQ